MNKIKKLLYDFNELVMFKHSIFALPFIFIAMIISSNGWFGWKLLILGLIATIAARNFAMAFNRYIDKNIDNQNPRTINRPSVDGRLSLKSIFLFIFLNAFLFILIAYFINQLAFYLSFPILFIIGVYSYFKRFSYLAHIILGISLGLAPISGVIAVIEDITLWSMFLSLGVVFWVAGFDMLYSLQDRKIDIKLKLHSIPVKFGIKKTLLIARISHTLAIIFWFLFTIYSSSGIFVYISIIISTIFLIYEHILVNKSLENIPKAFFTINGYLGIVFLIFVILDKIFI